MATSKRPGSTVGSSSRSDELGPGSSSSSASSVAAAGSMVVVCSSSGTLGGELGGTSTVARAGAGSSETGSSAGEVGSGAGMVRVAIGALTSAPRSGPGRAISPAEQDENAPMPKAARERRRTLGIPPALSQRARCGPSFALRNPNESRGFGLARRSVVYFWMAAESLESLSALGTQLSEDERLIQHSVRRFVDERYMPRAAQLFAEEAFPRDLIPELASLGVLGAS